jgi:hypothetical protein
MHQVSRALVVLAEHSRPRDNFAHHHPHHLRMTRGTLRQHPQRHFQRRDRAAAIFEQRRRKFLVRALAVFDQQRFLGREMQKEGGAGDVCRAADIVNRNRVETFL